MKFLSLTNGDAGHQSEGGGALAERRRAESEEAGRRFGIAEYEGLDNHGRRRARAHARGEGQVMDAHVSQFYGWLSWTQRRLAEVPRDAGERMRRAG